MTTIIKSRRICPGCYELTLTVDGETFDQCYVEKSLDGYGWNQSISGSEALYATKAEAKEAAEFIMLEGLEYAL